MKRVYAETLSIIEFDEKYPNLLASVPFGTPWHGTENIGMHYRKCRCGFYGKAMIRARRYYRDGMEMVYVETPYCAICHQLSVVHKLQRTLEVAQDKLNELRERHKGSIFRD